MAKLHYKGIPWIKHFFFRKFNNTIIRESSILSIENTLMQLSKANFMKNICFPSYGLRCCHPKDKKQPRSPLRVKDLSPCVIKFIIF